MNAVYIYRFVFQNLLGSTAASPYTFVFSIQQAASNDAIGETPAWDGARYKIRVGVLQGRHRRDRSNRKVLHVGTERITD